MPAAIKLDTLKFARRPTDAGMEPRVAEALVEGLSEADTSELALKADIARLEADIARLDTKIDATIAALKAELFRFLYLQAIGIVGLTVALIKLLPG